MEAIDSRILEVQRLSANQAYGKQKSQLQRELESFLCSLPSPELRYPLTSSVFWYGRTGKGKPKFMGKAVPLLETAAYERLRLYLSSLNIFDGETPHSFRSGVAIMLRLLGALKGQVASHLGWQSSRMVEHYTLVEKVLGLPGETGSPGVSSLDSSEILDRLCREFQERNMLRGYSPVVLDSI
ncbi:hypothetical protein AC249_AIPGENE2534 [Exaiptasia diaphana]|nr:hypothetical protein AC249_AIPGENE2534 [Exaiptasia diaphana]